jgi:hypothetical protein
VKYLDDPNNCAGMKGDSYGRRDGSKGYDGLSTHSLPGTTTMPTQTEAITAALWQRYIGQEIA